MICRSCGATIAGKAIICYRCGAATDNLSPGRTRSGGRKISTARLVVVFLIVVAFVVYLAIRLSSGTGVE